MNRILSDKQCQRMVTICRNRVVSNGAQIQSGISRSLRPLFEEIVRLLSEEPVEDYFSLRSSTSRQYFTDFAIDTIEDLCRSSYWFHRLFVEIFSAPEVTLPLTQAAVLDARLKVLAAYNVGSGLMGTDISAMSLETFVYHLSRGIFYERGGDIRLTPLFRRNYQPSEPF